MPEDLPEKLMSAMTAMMEIGWLMPLVGIAEILGGILFIIPKTRALGAVVIFPIMIGIMLTHTLQAPSGLPIAIALFAINLWVIYENKEAYQHMIK